MKHDAGLDVSIEETSICILDEGGRICRELKAISHPENISRSLNGMGVQLERVGLEAGPLSQWLFEGLAKVDLPAICIETRHAKAFLEAPVNKTDRNDARGIAQMMRVNLYRPVRSRTTFVACCAISGSGWGLLVREDSKPGSGISSRPCRIWERYSASCPPQDKSCGRPSPSGIARSWALSGMSIGLQNWL